MELKNMTKLILVRGLPGSGKSTLAKQIVGTKDDWVHIETDKFWKEDYSDFTFSKLKQAHQWCQAHTFNYLLDTINVVVSNTFTQRWEMESYFDMATKLGINPQIITCYGNFGSVHNVPEDVIIKMKNRFEHNIVF
jgi:uridine kinase